MKSTLGSWNYVKLYMWILHIVSIYNYVKNNCRCDSETALLQINPTARSELDVLKQRITELEAELEKKSVEIFDLNNENQKLRKELKS